MNRTSPRRDLVRLEVTKHSFARARLSEQFPHIDDETLADTLEGISDLREILAELVRSALEDEALSLGLSTRLADMRLRLERLRQRAEKKRSLALAAMAEAEIKTLVEPDYTASLRRSAPALEVL